MLRVQQPPMYDPEDVKPMRDELVAVGVTELHTPEEVDAAVEASKDGTALFIINSVCGCAAGGARPGIAAALQNGTIPDRLYTVFAGVDREATSRLREHIKGYPPSSPSAVIFKGGQPVFMLQRLDIEGYAPEAIAERMIEQFDKHCSAKGPSIPEEKFATLGFAKVCGSKLAAKAAAKAGQH
jgi:putative YphP/YqiW family bacilliredoxin